MDPPYTRLIDVETGPESTEGTPSLTKQAVFEWFQHSANDVDAQWVLRRVSEKKPHVFEEIVKESQRRRASTQTGAEYDTQVLHTWAERQPLESHSGIPVIQFASAVFHASEADDRILVIDVMRLGNQDARIEVAFETQDDSALAGRSYIATSGKVVFEPGESLAHIEIPIINNDLWDTSTEFRCILKDDGLVGAELGQYLWHTRIKIIDNNFFPTDTFGGVDTPAKIDACGKVPLMMGYCQMVSNIPRVWVGTIKYCLVDAFHNLWHLIYLFMTVYILDYIVDTKSPESNLAFSRGESLIVCSSITVVALAIEHFLDYSRLAFHVTGSARNFVQQALIRKFLNYKQHVHEKLKSDLSSGDIQMAVTRDAIELVSCGYINVLKMISACGKIFTVISFKLISPILFGKVFDYKVFVILCGMPLMLTIFLTFREKTMTKALKKKNEAQGRFVSQTALTTLHYHLVLHYSLEQHCCHQFQERQKDFGKAARVVNQLLVNNAYFCKWCQTSLVAIWFVYGGLQVIDGALSVGLFVTNLRLIGALGEASEDLYSLAVVLSTAFPGLENLTMLMNHPTDTRNRLALSRATRKITLEQRATMPIDIMPIVVSFDNVFRFEHEPKAAQLNYKGTVSIDQGQLTAILGTLGSGKATLLNLIAGNVLPQENQGSVFVPSHLRVANIADEPLFFGGTLYDNLIFGMNRDRPDASRERVKAIALRLTSSHTVVDHLDEDMEKAWHDIFSGAVCKLLCLARGLVQNYELLCIHKPLAKLSSVDADAVIEAFHDHINSKGLELHVDPTHRRPRTVIISANHRKHVSGAHDVLELDPYSGLRSLRNSDGLDPEAVSKMKTG